MSGESDFEDTVRICEFYADPCEAFGVDAGGLDSFFHSKFELEGR